MNIEEVSERNGTIDPLAHTKSAPGQSARHGDSPIGRLLTHCGLQKQAFFGGFEIRRREVWVDKLPTTFELHCDVVVRQRELAPGKVPSSAPSQTGPPGSLP